MRYSFALLTSICIGLVLALSSCCEPATKDSQPQLVDSLFQQSYGYDLDLFRTQNSANPRIPDSNYYPIYTFAVKNTGSQSDSYTLSLRLAGAGFDITKTVAPGQIAYFKTPVDPPDSLTSSAIYGFPNLTAADSNPPIPYAYTGLFALSPDSTRIRNLRPTISILYGSIDNGPEGCNTPAGSFDVNIDQFPK